MSLEARSHNVFLSLINKKQGQNFHDISKKRKNFLKKWLQYFRLRNVSDTADIFAPANISVKSKPYENQEGGCEI